MADRVTVMQTPENFAFLYDPPLGGTRYRVSWGGRAKGSSWQMGRALLTHGLTQKLRIMCTREYQASIHESVHQVLSSQITSLGYDGFYQVQDKNITGANGTEFIFKGIKRDIGAIKSTEGIDICWVEEAESVSEKSWKVLTPTIRKPRSEIWVSFNPGEPTDATYQRFVVKPPRNAIIRRASWKDNPFMTRPLYDEQAEMLINDPEGHAHVWGGEPLTRSDAQVLFGKWIVDEFTPDAATWDGPYYGGDWGFSTDPATLMRVWLFGGRLFIEMEAGGLNIDSDGLERMYREMQGDQFGMREVRTDPSRPETINELRQRGLNVVGASAWPGSVEDGIAHLRSYKQIVIHPSCTNTIREARLWRFKVDKNTDEVTNNLIPKNDHRWDAVRYALSPMIRKRKSPRLFFSGDDDGTGDEPGDDAEA